MAIDLHACLIALARLSLWLAILSAIFVPLERLFAVAHDGRRAPYKLEIGLYFLNSLLPATILAPIFGAVAVATRAILPPAYLGAVAALPLWAAIGAGLIVGELGAYWGHRLSHASPLLWRFHAVHHAPERLHFLSNTHAHPVDIVFIRLCALAPLYALGLADPAGVERTAVPIAVTLIGAVWTFFIHADLRWRFGPLEWLVSTPAFHHWHHANDEHRHQNFASLLPILDRLFGTHHLPDHFPASYGLDAPPVATAPAKDGP